MSFNETNVEGEVYDINYIQVKDNVLKNLFFDYFMYIDVLDEEEGYCIDEIIQKNDFDKKVKFVNGDFFNPECRFIVSTIRCPHKHSRELRKNIFPQLHKKLYNKFGDEYYNFCMAVAQELIEEADRMGVEVDEVLSRPVTD